MLSWYYSFASLLRRPYAAEAIAEEASRYEGRKAMEHADAIRYKTQDWS